MSDDKQELTALHMVDQNGHVGEVPTGVQFALKVGSGGAKLSINGDAAGGGGASAGGAAGLATPAAGTATVAAAPSGANPVVSSASVSGSGQGVRTLLVVCAAVRAAVCVCTTLVTAFGILGLPMQCSCPAYTFSLESYFSCSGVQAWFIWQASGSCDFSSCH